MHKHLEKICEIKHKLIEAVEDEMSKPVEHRDTEELGEVIDMIKDLAEAEEKCIKAAYYDAMIGEDGEPEESRMGYNPRRYASGRYAPKGAGHMGYVPMHMMEEHEYGPWANSRMGYPTGGNNPSMNRSATSGQSESYRGGYPIGENDERYGRAYNEYRDARRHYTTSHSEADKKRMNEHATKHVEESIMTMRDIWAGSDPEAKKRIKGELNSLLSEMNV